MQSQSRTRLFGAAEALPAPIRRFFPELEALRGVAIGLVLACHLTQLVAGHEIRGVHLSPLEAFGPGGHTGVTLFFALSGFLLARPFLAHAWGGAPVSRAAYFRGRALRILPLYVPAVLIAALLDARAPAQLWRAVPHLLFLTPWSNLAPPLPPASWPWWSLSTEVQFYLVLPLVAGLLCSRRARPAAAAVFVAWLAAYVALVSGAFRLARPAGLGTLLSLLTRAPAFALGAVLAACEIRYGARLQRALAARSWLRAGAGDLALAAAILALGVLLQAVVFRGFWQAEVHWQPWHIAEGALWVVVMALLLFAPLRLRPLLVNRPMSALGRISYSLYLVHLPVMVALVPFLQAHLPTAAVLAILAVASLTAGTVVYAAVERPALAWKRRSAGARPVAQAPIRLR
jgi:peptidoglycan/LPS O-acetylase OafA/YrhL